MTRSPPSWTVVIAVILALQTVSATLGRLVPVAGPAFTLEFGWDQAWVGYLAAASIVGALFVLTSGIGLMHRLGGVRALQLSLLVGSASLSLYLVPSITMALIASICVGLSSGTANPAGSEVLTRYTPREHRNLVFSIKQAGVPLGGIVGGVAIPPLIDWLGWRFASVVIAAVCIVAVLATWPFQKSIDPLPEERAHYRLLSFRLTDILVPMRSLSRGDRLWRASWVGGLLAIPQAGWITFLVTYLVVALGQSLNTAGFVFAVMQTSSMFGRVILGWVADRVGSGPGTLMMASIGSAISTILLGLSTPAWPLWAFLLLAAFAGIAVSGWNGVQIAEVARRSPPELIGETAAGSVIMIFLSNMLTPVAFAVFIAATNRYDLAFLISGVFSLICVPILYGIDRRPTPDAA
ncbi:MFS transporter [Rhodoplanes sp. Z2-YC6860]|uniref:MFS transporter n=1 Tax=Rhodoplanes sp. Z2-YC6860 TaxID=674703 RepID=UPI00078D1445|nr:MFS transporter [Rhodoplanes sp. Z2-YC6860]AMN39570.1 MFS family transporter [Rhodoplanes sp. Z2-YC6860]